MKRLHTLVLCAILLLVYNGCAWAQEAPEVAARGAVLVDRASGRILYNHDMNEMLPMASTTKIMTALLAFENGNLDQMVTAGPNASGVTGTSIYLSEGEQLSMSDMLKGLMLQSGNDAAVAIAEHLGGSVENFAEMMNRRARELDADANFVTPNGLDAEVVEGLRANFTGECTEVGMYLAMSRQADREGYPEVAEAYKRIAFEEAEHAAKFAELLGEDIVYPDTKKNLTVRVEAEHGATAGKLALAKRAKELGYDAIHDTVHEMCKDEARHGKAFNGLLKRYF